MSTKAYVAALVDGNGTIVQLIEAFSIDTILDTANAEGWTAVHPSTPEQWAAMQGHPEDYYFDGLALAVRPGCPETIDVEARIVEQLRQSVERAAQARRESER